MNPVEVYTDGAYSQKSRIGGWAWVTEDGSWDSGREKPSSSQRMELKAALEAMRAFPEPILIISDSAYLVNCFLDEWWVGWERRKWRKSDGKEVINQDLWRPLIALVKRRGDIAFKKVKGHSSHPLNDEADRRAVAARTTVRF